MSEERLGVLQHYRTRSGRQLRFTQPRCRTCGQPHARLYQAEPIDEPETWGDFWRALAVLIFLLVALAATIVAAVGYAPAVPA